VVDSSIVIQFLAVDSEERWICQSIFTFYRIARSRYIHSRDTSIT